MGQERSVGVIHGLTSDEASEVRAIRIKLDYGVRLYEDKRIKANRV